MHCPRAEVLLGVDLLSKLYDVCISISTILPKQADDMIQACIFPSADTQTRPTSPYESLLCRYKRFILPWPDK